MLGRQHVVTHLDGFKEIHSLLTNFLDQLAAILAKFKESVLVAVNRGVDGWMMCVVLMIINGLAQSIIGSTMALDQLRKSSLRRRCVLVGHWSASSCDR